MFKNNNNFISFSLMHKFTFYLSIFFTKINKKINFINMFIWILYMIIYF